MSFSSLRDLENICPASYSHAMKLLLQALQLWEHMGVSYAVGSRDKKTGSLLEDFGTLEFEGLQKALGTPQMQFRRPGFDPRVRKIPWRRGQTQR